jgi:hypothetical protein
MNRRSRAWTVALALAATAAFATPATAAVPFKEIVSASGPLTSVALGDELSCQVAYTGDARFELFPSASKPGDCGTLVFVGDTLFAPNFSAHDASAASSIGTNTAFTPVSQSAVSGTGTAANPFKVTTIAAAGATGVQIAQVDSYITGQESYRTDTTVQNGGGGAATGILYRAGDCYLQENDTGFGFLDAAAGAVGCSINANNSPAARIEQWFPITGGNQFMEGSYSDVWGHIATHTPFPNTTRATEQIDNGAGISWSFSLAPGGSATYSHYTTFSPRGVSGPPPAAQPGGNAAVPGIAFGPNGLLSTPTNLRCVSKRYFQIKLRKKFWPSIAAVTIKVPRRPTKVLRRKPWGTNVDLRGFPKGTFIVRITALTATGKTIRGTRKYKTCHAHLRGGIPPL